MSTISAIFKGFAATIVAGISAISYSSTNIWILGLSFLPVLVFAVLDIYYLKLERKFRFLFDQVRLDEHEIDFSMKLTNDPVEIIRAKARTWDCIKSPKHLLVLPIDAGGACCGSGFKTHKYSLMKVNCYENHI